MPERSLSSEEIGLLCQELQAMIDAGVPLGAGLRGLGTGASARLERAGECISLRLEQGASLADALGADPSLPADCRMALTAGLRCGRSGEVLGQTARLASSLHEFRQTMRQGLIYPAAVILIAGGLLSVVVAGFLPRLAVLYKSEKLPVPRWLAWQEELPWLPVWGAVGLGLALLAMIVWPFGPRQTLGAGLRWLPGGGRLLDELQAARAAQLLALLLRYSVPWPEALRLTGAALAQPRWRRPLEELAEAASRGELPQQGRRRLRGVPPFLAWLLASGAGQSDLVPALSHAAEYYRERALARGAWMQQVLPAATVVLVGGAITLLYGLAVFGPMTELWEQLARAGQ